MLLAGGLSLAAARPAGAAVHGGPKPAVVKVTGTDRPRGALLAATVTDARGAPGSYAPARLFELTKDVGPSRQHGPPRRPPEVRFRFDPRRALTGGERGRSLFPAGPGAAADAGASRESRPYAVTGP